MSEPFLKSRPGVGGYDAQGARAGLGIDREDPLAELARLVGKDDPFRGGTTRAPAAIVSPFPQLGAPQHAEHPEDESYEPHPDDVFGDNQEAAYPDFDAQLRGSLDTRHAEDLRQRDSLRFPPVPAPHEDFDPDPSYSSATRGEAPPLNADLWAEGALPQEPMQPGPFDAPLPTSEGEIGVPPRRTVMVLAAVLLLTGGGLGATFLMREGSGVTGGNGSTPTIMASDTPVKVQSPDVANGGSPDGNTALLEKTGSDKVDNAKVVTKVEQPVDLNQLPKPATSPADSAPAQAAAPPNAFPEPRKVKTVLIRPDGSVVGDAPQASPGPAIPGGVVMPAAADGGAPAQADVAPPPSPPAPVAKPSTPKSTARVSATPKDPNAGPSGAKQAAAPAHVVKPKPVAVADASTPADTAPAATPGSWSVQLAAPPSEQEAKETAARLQKKFAGELGGQKPSIHKADKDGKSIYRIRVGGQSQDDAKALCSKLQASGGSCFVVRN